MIPIDIGYDTPLPAVPDRLSDSRVTEAFAIQREAEARPWTTFLTVCAGQLIDRSETTLRNLKPNQSRHGALLQKNAAVRFMELASTVELMKQQTPIRFDSLSHIVEFAASQQISLTQLDQEILAEFFLREETHQSEFDLKYGVLTLDKLTPKIFEYLHQNPANQGVLIEDDLVGLKSFNIDDPKYGDQAIANKIMYWRSLLTHYYGDAAKNNPDLINQFIGRKGDEIYVFIPGKTADEVTGYIQEFNQQHRAEVDVMLDVTIHNGETEKHKKAVSYWKAAQVNKDTFDDQMRTLESSIEEVKVSVVKRVIDLIVNGNDADHSRRQAIFLCYLRDEKRVSEAVIDNLLKTMFHLPDDQAFREMTTQTYKSSEIVEATRQVIEQALALQQQQESPIIPMPELTGEFSPKYL